MSLKVCTIFYENLAGPKKKHCMDFNSYSGFRVCLYGTFLAYSAASVVHHFAKFGPWIFGKGVELCLVELLHIRSGKMG